MIYNEKMIYKSMIRVRGTEKNHHKAGNSTLGPEEPRRRNSVTSLEKADYCCRRQPLTGAVVLR